MQKKHVHGAEGTWMLSGTIHLHLIKFSLLLPVPSAVTAPAPAEKVGIFCTECWNAAVPAQLRSRDAQERSTCLQLGVSNASFYSVGDFGGDFDLLCQHCKVQPNRFPEDCVLPRVPAQGSALRCLSLLSAELTRSSPGASQGIFSSSTAWGNCSSTSPFPQQKHPAAAQGPCCSFPCCISISASSGGDRRGLSTSFLHRHPKLRGWGLQSPPSHAQPCACPLCLFWL